ncbi:MAG: TonB-dependent receptor, partial [Rhodothermales bacterium]|nr:TonB-dependent receptor [Rhodothermales bacterium]
FKAGYEVMVSDLDFGPPGILANVTRNGVEQLLPRTDTTNAIVNSYRPRQGAAFLQDRIEWRDLRVRAGLRVEMFDANTTVPSDLANPANSIEGAPESRPIDTTVKVRIAPRLGVSFPITDRASMFFSYGLFYQLPGLGDFFGNADYSILRDLQAGTEEEVGVLGNPDLKPERTAQYEFGFKSEIASWLGLDISLFYKDIRDLLGVEFVQTYTAAQYAHFTNVDFGQVRGFTLQLDQRGPGALSTSLDYTFQYATGNSSDPRETFNRAAAGEDPLPRQIPFNWDQRHTLNGVLTWFEANNFAVTAILKLGSGQPYTPTISSTFGGSLEPNSGRKATFLLVDLRAEKFFRFGGFRWTVFARVFNLFDEHFVNGFVFPDTGSPFYTLLPEARRSALINPGRFHSPRRIEIGMSLRGIISK